MTDASRPAQARSPGEQGDGGVVDDRLHDAIRQLRQHVSTIQAAKRRVEAGGPLGENPLLACVNALPAIVLQLEAAEFEIEAAFERYEDDEWPATRAKATAALSTRSQS